MGLEALWVCMSPGISSNARGGRVVSPRTGINKYEAEFEHTDDPSDGARGESGLHVMIESLWLSEPLALAGKTQPRRLNHHRLAGSKRTFSSTMAHLAGGGVDAQALWASTCQVK